MGGRALRACAAAVLAAGLLACAGCRDSDALVEVVYTQDSPIVDADAEQKNYELSAGADQTVPLDRATEAEGDVSSVTEQQDIPVFGVPATTDEQVDQVLYDSGSGVSRTAPIFPDRPQELADDQDLRQDVSNGGSDYDSPDDGSADDEEGPEENDRASRGVSMHSDATKVYNSSGGLLAPLADVQCVATVGEHANLALALGGPGTLVAGDDAFLDDEDIRRVFSAEGWELDEVPAVWSFDEATGSYTCDFDALLAADPDLVWVPDGTDLLTDEQTQQLLDLGINVEPAPRMSSVAAIREMARWLGDTLADHTVSGRDASAAATSYLETYLGSDIDALVEENGGLTTYGGVDYSGQGGAAASETTWTVLVTDWDAEASYNAGIWEARGVAIATAGYGWSPADYYLSVGGVNNNAAQFPVAAMAGRTTGDYYVWQFNMSMLDPARVVGVKAVEDFGETSYGWSECLVGAPATVNREAAFETTLGADDFLYVICATDEAAQALAAARDEGTASQTGLYAAYDYSRGEALQESGVGPRTADGVLIRAVIGASGEGELSIGQERAAAGENPYEVVACGNGLYCDWVAGSMESFLLAFWTDDFYDAGGAGDPDLATGGAVDVGAVDFSGLDEEASRFYLEFYGYELTEQDLEQIH